MWNANAEVSVNRCYLFFFYSSAFRLLLSDVYPFRFCSLHSGIEADFCRMWLLMHSSILKSREWSEMTALFGIVPSVGIPYEKLVHAAFIFYACVISVELNCFRLLQLWTYVNEVGYIVQTSCWISIAYVVVCLSVFFIACLRPVKCCWTL